MIYVPDYTDSKCAYMQSNNVLRVYNEKPRNNSTIEYVDYMVDNHYLFRTGYTSFGQYTNLPECLESSVITNSYLYRTDLVDILVIFFLLVGFVYFIISRLLRALFKGGRIL